MIQGVRRFELVLIGALALSAPSLVQALTGGVGLTTALVHVALALALAWGVGAVLERTIDTYARQARQRELHARLERVRGARGLTASRGDLPGPERD